MSIENTQLKSKQQVATLLSAIAMIAMAVYVHIFESWAPVVLAVLAVISLAGALFSAFLWDKSAAFRRFVRIALIAVPAAVVIFAIVCVVEGMIVDPYTKLWYECATFGTLAVQFAQTWIAFTLPVTITAAAFGFRFDRILVGTMGTLNLAMVAYLLYFAIPEGYVVVDEKSVTWNTVYLLLTAVVTLLCLASASKGMFKRPRKKKENA